MLSPAYDLTFSSSLDGVHATMIAGNGKDHGLEDVLQVADLQNLSPSWARKVAEEIQEKTQALTLRFQP